MSELIERLRGPLPPMSDENRDYMRETMSAAANEILAARHKVLRTLTKVSRAEARVHMLEETLRITLQALADKVDPVDPESEFLIEVESILNEEWRR